MFRFVHSNGVLTYVGAVEFGIEGVRLADLDRLARPRPAVPRLLCVVRFAGWRPSGAHEFALA